MANFGDLVLVLGDLHIPERANAIPENFKKMLVPNKMQHVICTGNIGMEQYRELCALVPGPNHFHAVKGDSDGADLFGLNLPEARVVRVGEFSIGVVHGHQLLPSAGSGDARSRMRRKLGVDVLITGHTHRNEVFSEDGCYYINPGSITGACSATTPDASPSFVLLAVQGAKLVCYVYEIGADGEVDVSKTEFSKPVRAVAPSSLPAGSGHPALLQSLLA